MELAVSVQTDGTTQVVVLPATGKWERISRMINPSGEVLIDRVRTGFTNCSVWVDESGRLKNLDPNPYAQLVTMHPEPIVGPMVLTGPPEDHTGEIQGFTPEQAEALAIAIHRAQMAITGGPTSP